MSDQTRHRDARPWDGVPYVPDTPAPERPDLDMDHLLDHAVAAARRGPTAKPNKTDRKIVDAAHLHGSRHTSGPQRTCPKCISTWGTVP
jgi:hypothetical protein